MARINSHTCDVCGQPATLAFKVWLSPVRENDKGYKQRHSNYEKHADIGVCCADKWMEEINWRERRTIARKKVAA